MPIDATVVLGRFRYLRPAIGNRVSPYIWPFLASIASKPRFDYRHQTVGDARVVIMNDMGPAHTPDIPASEATLATQFDDDQTDPSVLLIVALWEKLDTPDKAVRAAFEAFKRELPLRLGHRLPSLQQAIDTNDQDTVNVLIKEIEDLVARAIRSAIEDNLSWWDKAKIQAGWMHLDQFVATKFRLFSPLSATPFTLAFQGTAFEVREYEIQGNLHLGQVTPPVNPADLCPDEVRAVNAAKSAVDGINGQIRVLQEQLHHASPSEKAAIVREIERIREQELAPANAALEEAERALRVCLDGQLVPIPIPHRPPR